MSKVNKLKPIASALGITLLAGLVAAPIAQADENPFAVSELKSGYMVSMASDEEAESKDTEGKCGEGKCGEDKDDDKDSEGKCGEGKCGEGDKEQEGSCGAA